MQLQILRRDAFTTHHTLQQVLEHLIRVAIVQVSQQVSAENLASVLNQLDLARIDQGQAQSVRLVVHCV